MNPPMGVPVHVPDARRLIAAGVIRRAGARQTTIRVTAAGVTGSITPLRDAR